MPTNDNVMQPEHLGITPPVAIKYVLYSVFFAPLAIGVIAAQKLNFQGEFYCGELLALIYILINGKILLLRKSIRSLIWLAIVWATWQLISDIINNNDLITSVKGIGAPVLFLSTVVAITNFADRDFRRMPSFLLGVQLGLIPQFIFYPSTYFSGNPWKWGFGLFILEVFCIYFTFFYKSRRYFILLVFLVIFTIVGLANNSRSLAVFPTFSAAAYILFNSKYSKSVLKIFGDPFGALKLFLSIVVVTLFINIGFTGIFSSSYFSRRITDESSEKFKSQAQGHYGVLLGGRSEMLVSIDAFLDKPLFGHGSWAKDKSGYQQALALANFRLGYSDTDTASFATDLIPVHSYLMGALVWAGVGGGMFWIFMIRWLLRQFIANAIFFGFYFYNGIVLMMWNIFFSPFGASARWSTAVFVASLCWFSNFILKSTKLR